MARTKLSTKKQVRESNSYISDSSALETELGLSSVFSSEAELSSLTSPDGYSLEDDLNVLRTMVHNIKGSANWYDDMATKSLVGLESSISGLDTRLDDVEVDLSNLIVSIGAMVDSDGNFVQFSGSNYLDAATDMTGAFTALDTQVKSNEDRLAALEQDEAEGDEEDGYQNAFIGKDAFGDEMPSYSSNNFVVDGSSLEDAIGAMDAAVKSALDLKQDAMTGGDGIEVDGTEIKVDLADVDPYLGFDSGKLKASVSVNYLGAAAGQLMDAEDIKNEVDAVRVIAEAKQDPISGQDAIDVTSDVVSLVLDGSDYLEQSASGLAAKMAADLNSAPAAGLLADALDIFNKFDSISSDIADQSEEDGYQNAFMGKALGDEMPDYSSNNYVVDATSLEDAIGVLDAALKSNADDVIQNQGDIQDINDVIENLVGDGASNDGSLGSAIDVDGNFTSLDGTVIGSSTNFTEALESLDDGYDALLAAISQQGSSLTIQDVYDNSRSLGQNPELVVATSEEFNVKLQSGSSFVINDDQSGNTDPLFKVDAATNEVRVGKESDGYAEPFFKVYGPSDFFGSMTIQGDLTVTGDSTIVDSQVTDFDHQLISPSAASTDAFVIRPDAGFNNKIMEVNEAGSTGGDIVDINAAGTQIDFGRELDMNSNKIVGLADGVNADDAVNLSQLNAVAANVNLQGAYDAQAGAQVTGSSDLDFNISGAVSLATSAGGMSLSSSDAAANLSLSSAQDLTMGDARVAAAKLSSSATDWNSVIQAVAGGDIASVGIIDAINAAAQAGGGSAEKGVFIVANADSRLVSVAGNAAFGLEVSASGGASNADRGEFDLASVGLNHDMVRDTEVYLNGQLMLADASAGDGTAIASDDFYIYDSGSSVYVVVFSFEIKESDIITIVNRNADATESR